MTKQAQEDEKIASISLKDFADTNYHDYGVATLEDRAIPDYRDGMLPVNRRLLWTAHTLGLSHKHKFVKSALVVGTCLGKFHPHSDVGCYKSLVGMSPTKVPIGLIDIAGNWGSMSEPNFAAMRYTETRLSNFSDQVLFDKFYLAVTEHVPNYDGSLQEPVVLPALLPVVLLNGRSGIATGATTYVPKITPASLLKAIKYSLSNELDAKYLNKTLEFTTTNGGKEILSEDVEVQNARKKLFKSSTGSVYFRSTMTFNEKTRCISVTKFAEVPAMESLLGKLQSLEGVTDARDDSTKNDRYATVSIFLKKADEAKLKKVIKSVKKVLSSKENYVLTFTERYVDKIGQGAATLCSMSLVDTLNKWKTWRLQLEVKASGYWADKAQTQIDYLELLCLAVDNRKLIIESLDKDCSQKDLELWLSKKLKITENQAAIIYDLKVKQLRKLEKNDLQTQIKEVQKQKALLLKRVKDPAGFVVTQIDEFTKLFN